MRTPFQFIIANNKCNIKSLCESRSGSISDKINFIILNKFKISDKYCENYKYVMYCGAESGGIEISNKVGIFITMHDNFYWLLNDYVHFDFN